MMNNHNITIDETFTAIAHSINNDSYNTIDYLYNVMTSSLYIGAFVLSILIISKYANKLR